MGVHITRSEFEEAHAALDRLTEAERILTPLMAKFGSEDPGPPGFELRQAAILSQLARVGLQRWLYGATLDLDEA